MSSVKKSPRVLRAVVTSGKALSYHVTPFARGHEPSTGVTTLHFESGSKNDSKDSIPALNKQSFPATPRVLTQSEQRTASSFTGSSGSASLAEALRIIGGIGAAPLSVASIVERCDAAAIALIGCTRTRLFLLSEVLDDESDGISSAAAQRLGDRMRAMQVGAPDAEHPVSGCAGTCMRTQQLLLYNDIAAATDFVPAMEGCGARPPISQAFAPVTIPGSLHSKATILGALQVGLVELLTSAPTISLTLCRL